MNLLVLKGFNNYFNRKIKKYSTLQDYIDNSSLHYNFENVNFNPNDGVTTSQIVGNENQVDIGGSNPEPLKWEFEGTPDYIVCYETEIIDDNPVFNIKSRWFILECVRTRLGQYQLALKRDVIADHLEQVLSNPCFVEKGYVAPNNPLIFNEEGVSFNEVKKGETMLTDETGIPWIVLYIAKNYPNSATGVNTTLITDLSESAMPYTDLPWSNIETPDPQFIDTSFTRRIASGAELNISPLATLKLNMLGVGRYLLNAVRANLRYFYSSGDWSLDSVRTDKVYYDKTITTIEYAQKVYSLKRKNININTNPNYNVRWGDDGVIVPTYWVEELIAPLYNEEWGWYDTGNIIDGVLYRGGLNPTNDPAKIAYIKNYLNTKMAECKSNTAHSAVPGAANTVAYAGGNQSFLPTSELLSYNGKLIKRGSNIYRIKITEYGTYTRPLDHFTVDGDNNIVATGTNNLAQNLAKYADVHNTVNPNNNMVETFFEHTWLDIKYERVTSERLRCGVQVPGSRVCVNDAAYDMICIPYGPIKVGVPASSNPDDQDTIITVQKEASIAAARGIAEKLTSDSVYDIQVLPYCPIRELAEQYKDLLYDSLDLIATPWPAGFWAGVYKCESTSETPTAEDPDLRKNMRSVIFWCNYTHGTFDINKKISIPEADSIEYKVYNNCKKFRLVAPNYTSIFEFEPLKNNGINIFNVDFNYRPYNPYIHIAPLFKSESLYGIDTNDQRGLILQGDFSVGYYSDKWAEYQVQNANYANIFNREMQNLKRNQNIEIWQHAVAGGFDAVANTFGAARAGSNTGNPIADALMGTQMLGKGFQGQLIGAAADAYFMGKSMAEARSFKKDMYELQLGTIKALPNGLAKSDALTENFKYFPFIEEFESTEIEKEVFRQKLKYDGMTVNAIGTLADYVPATYEIQRLKGQLIMQDNLVDDFQVAEDIYKEVDKGFYLVDKGE